MLGDIARMEHPLLLFVILGILAVGGVIAARFAKPSHRFYPKELLVWERIRQEVYQEFEPSIRQSTGLRRYWLILKRNREVSRRAARVIYVDVA